jgi:glycosyltransferase involved in cell wall biosynthesis
MDAYRAMTILHVIASVNPADGGPIEGVTRQSIYSLEYGSGAREVVSLDPPDAPWVAACPLTVYAMGAHSYEVAKKYRRLPWIKYGFSLRFVKWLRENAENYDGIVVNGLWNFIALGFVMALGGRKVDYVVYTHGMLDPWFQKTYPLKAFFKQLVWLVADGRLVNSASAVLFTSEEERELARNAFFPYHPREKVVAYGSSDVPEGAVAQAAAFQASVPHIGNRKYLLYLSRIHPKKGCDLLIEAFARVADQYPELDLVIAGPDQIGMVKELQALADRLGIGGRIHWPGMLTGDAKWGAFRQAEAFILPSHQENFGIVVAEAMACGTPALISNKVNIWREVEASGGGMVEPDTAEGAYRLMSKFLTLEPAARQNMSVQARAGYDAHFSIGSAAEALEKTIFETKRSWSRPRLDA